MSYFFNARGTELEKSPIGLYRTLLYQLCVDSMLVRQKLGNLYETKRLQASAGEIYWHFSELRDIYHEMIIHRRLHLVEVFVDALDECADEDVRQVVRSFADSAAEVVLNGSRIRICWSSRHYPHISIKYGIELRMEDLNRADIAKYVQQQFEVSSVLSSELSFATEIVSKAQGFFLWTVLVVRRLLKAADQGRAVNELQDILQKTPIELNELFQNIFASLDSELRTETLHLIQWVLFSRSPLHIDELQIALAYSSDCPPRP